jgi:predicted DNA-binding transcriptional regulator YafY
MLPWLAARGGASTTELAERFGISEPEVVSMLELAACCGLPPYTPDQLMELIVSDGWVEARLGRHLSRPRRLTPAEGFTLAASARAILAVPGADPEGALARALGKLDGVLGARVDVGLDEPPLLELVRQAAGQGHSLRIEYYSASRDELSTRQVDVWNVFARDGHWYLDGWCHLAGGRRLFRVDRIREAHVLDAAEEPRPAPGLSSREVPETFVPGPETRLVTIETGPGGHWVVESYPTERVEELSGGRLRITLGVGGRAWLERLLLRLGADAKVLGPAELSDVGRKAAARLLARYE